MYCKKCGKRLPPGARFCDRCNTSVRSKGGKMDQIEDLKEERLARRKAKEVEERLKGIKKVRRKRYKIILGIIITLVVLGIASAIASNIMFSRNSMLNNPIDDVPDTTEKVSEEKPTAMVVEGVAVTEAASEKPVVNRDGYMELTKDGISFAYPSSFTSDEEDKDVFLSLKDSMGDAVIKVYKETTSAKTETEAMKKYRDSKGITVTQATTTDGCYSVTGTKDDMTYHSFGHVEDGIAFWYELSYPTSAAKAESYGTAAAYMDNYLKSKNYSGDDE